MIIDLVVENWRRVGLGAAGLALVGGGMAAAGAAHATTVSSVAATDVSIFLSTASRAPIGRTTPATVSVTNRGPAATSVKTFVKVPAGLTITSATGGTVLDGGRSARFDQPTLLSGQNTHYGFTYSVGTSSGNKILVADAVVAADLDYRNNTSEKLLTVYHP